MTFGRQTCSIRLGDGVLIRPLTAFLTPVLGGGLLACSFFSSPTHWLAWIGLVPVASAIAQRGTVAATYAGMYCAGLTFNLITTDWIRTLDGGAGMAGHSAPDWLLQSQLLALFWPLTLFLGRLLVANWHISMGLALPAVWIIHEYLLRHAWTFVDGTGWQVYFLGYAIVDHRYVTQIGDLGGVSALSFVAACVNGAAWDLFCLCRSRQSICRTGLSGMAGVATAALLLAFSYCYGAWAISQTQFGVGPNIWLMPESILSQTADRGDAWWHVGGAPDLLLWSELAYRGPSVNAAQPLNPINVDADARENHSGEDLVEICRRFDTPVVIGYMRIDNARSVPKKYNSAAFVDPQDGFQGSYDKVGLVPWTEFTPWEGLTARKSAQYCHGRNYPVFTLYNATTHKATRFAIAICYDVAFARIFQRYMQAAEGTPDFFVVCSSERTDRSGRLSRHVLNLAKLRAIECRRSVVRNVQFGHSGTIDSTGHLRHNSIPQSLQSPTQLGEIPIDRRSTIYVLLGDWIPFAIVGVIAIGWGTKICSKMTPIA